MNTQLTLKVLTLGILLLATHLFAATLDSGEHLQARATTLWHARVQEDWATEYRLLSPDETHEVTEEQFITFRKDRGPLRFLSAEVGDIAVAGTIGWVDVKYTAQPSAHAYVPPQHIQKWDVWQLKGDQWYPLPTSQRLLVPRLPPQRRSASEEAVLAERVQALWEARAHQDVNLLYQFLAPRYQQQISREQFSQRRDPVVYLSHDVEWTEVIGEHGRVKVMFTYTRHDASPAQQEPPEDVAAPQQSFVIEEWIKTDGQWYRRLP